MFTQTFLLLKASCEAFDLNSRFRPSSYLLFFIVLGYSFISKNFFFISSNENFSLNERVKSNSNIVRNVNS